MSITIHYFLPKDEVYIKHKTWQFSDFHLTIKHINPIIVRINKIYYLQKPCIKITLRTSPSTYQHGDYNHNVKLRLNLLYLHGDTKHIYQNLRFLSRNIAFIFLCFDGILLVRSMVSLLFLYFFPSLSVFKSGDFATT